MSSAISLMIRSVTHGSFALCRFRPTTLSGASQHVIDRLSHFWTTDRSLSVFLWLLLIAVFILAPLADRKGMLFVSAGFFVLLISGVLLAAKNRMTRVS